MNQKYRSIRHIEDTHKTHKPYKSDGHYSIVQKNTEEMLKRLNNVKKAAHHDVQRFHRSNDRKSIGSSSQVQQRNKSFFDSSPKRWELDFYMCIYKRQHLRDHENG
jgi:hypothetical protein